MEHQFCTDTIRIGKKGQITLPKKIRDADVLGENDSLTIMHLPNGDILLRKVDRNVVDQLFSFLDTVPKIDMEKAWREIEAEREDR